MSLINAEHVLLTEATLTFECSDVFYPQSFNAVHFLPRVNNFTISKAYVSTAYINSHCCDNISISSLDISCSRCSENGIKVCNITEESIQIKNIEDADCAKTAQIRISCTSQVCPLRNSTEYRMVNKPGEDTGCSSSGRKSVCSKHGDWTDVPCSINGRYSNRRGWHIVTCLIWNYSARAWKLDRGTNVYIQELLNKLTYFNAGNVIKGFPKHRNWTNVSC